MSEEIGKQFVAKFEEARKFFEENKEELFESGHGAIMSVWCPTGEKDITELSVGLMGSTERMISSFSRIMDDLDNNFPEVFRLALTKHMHKKMGEILEAEANSL